jgi:hydroxymethylpyrimidine kinase/phosphomethylpyrimidine kinase/thiamine-phosphate diphosphorylase
LKTITALGGHGCGIVSSLTAQNTKEFYDLQPVPSYHLQTQLEALQHDLPPNALKIGLIADREVIRFLSKTIPTLRELYPNLSIICDPIVRASSGRIFLGEADISFVCDTLLPLVDVLTPNLPEAECLTGLKLSSPADIENAGARLLQMGAKCVVVKGGHAETTLCQDFFITATEKFWLSSPRLPNCNARGTGCTFASAIATALAFGFCHLDAAVIAKSYLNQCLRLRRPLSHLGGADLLGAGTWPAESMDLPWLSHLAHEPRRRFADCGPERLGFYPIVDRANWLKRLLPLGIRTIQLRIKDLHRDALETEIRDAISIARQYKCRLFINDHWQLALRHSAYGVHLGQEDLEEADLDVISRKGICLGISTHSYAELARANAMQPSYVALGPIYPTQIKAMRFAPQGLHTLSVWRKLLGRTPLVAIGGISLESAEELLTYRPDSLAVVSDITCHPTPEARARAWLAAFPQYPA